MKDADFGGRYLSLTPDSPSSIKLGTGLTLLAQRNAVVLSKEMASLDHLSDGRLILGLGAGYLKAEFDALGVTFKERGARSDEYIDAMRELWTSDQPECSGRYVNFSAIQSRPQPAQSGGPEIVIGGTSAAAYRRAVSKAVEARRNFNPTGSHWFFYPGIPQYFLSAMPRKGLIKDREKK